MPTTETPSQRPVPPKLASTMPLGYMLVRPGITDEDGNGEDALVPDWDGTVHPTLEEAQAQLPNANARPWGYHVFALFRVEGCDC